MKPCLLLLAAYWFVQGEARAHDIITTSITWTRDISRIVNNHCASCHHPTPAPGPSRLRRKFFAGACPPGARSKVLASFAMTLR